MKAQAHRSRGRSREIHLEKTANARDAIGEIERGCEIYILTFGQFSLMDSICEVLRQIGPADVVISTWTAANADLHRTAESVKHAEMRSLRWIVDRSFVSRQPGYCATMRELFGDNCIRTARTHAKFVLLQNEHWNVAIRTSMNLNENPRLENIEISEDPALCSFLLAVTDEIFSEQTSGDMMKGLPLLAAIQDGHPPPRIRMGKARTGVATCGPRNT